MTRPVVATVFGTRPEAIKMAPVVLAFLGDPQLEHRLVVTAQHRGLLDEVLELFALRPDHDLDLMRERQSLEHVTSGALSGLCDYFRQIQPAFVLVHGDTTTTFAASLAAFYCGVPVGHVEAGLRTSDLRRPFPEEANRRLTDLLATHYYCPTHGAAVNLLANRDYRGEIFITGNTALDSVRLVYEREYSFADGRLAEFALHSGPRLLVTAHRRENWGAPMAEICRGLLAALEEHPSAHLCFCWHPNPAVREVVGPLLGEHPRVLLIDPPRYDAFINLLGCADLVLSDSGGIQEEVTQLRRFALVLRDETERPEAIDAGFARVIGTRAESVRQAVADYLPRCLAGSRHGSGGHTMDVLPLPAADARSPFGDGHSAGRIRQAVRYALGLEAAGPADYGV